ncbi:conserved hypothetical protein [Ricinus communis]|uniref:Uncharacterized protein n=1 Tax=Ricinus communis TaxID=3988 RepID=B9RFU1_RICCO|nr:conserved hypothetical protein [Ricinus communis]
MDFIARRLERIHQEVEMVENVKLQKERRLGAFWEHLPALDPVLVRDHMLYLTQQITSLENRKRLLLEEEQELIVHAVILCHRQSVKTATPTAVNKD